MKIAWSVGHSQRVRGMRGNPVPPECDEVDECLRISTSVCQLLQANGVECPMFFDTTSTSQSQYLAAQANWTNAQHADLGVQCHLNAGGGDKAVGCEVWYYSQEALARKVATAMATALNLPDRGPKWTSSLSWIMNSDPPCILLECFFGDSTTDCNHYRAAGAYDRLVTALAESIAGIKIDGDTEEPPPERPPIEPSEPPTEVENYIEMRTAAQPGVQVLINGLTIHGTYVPGQPVVDLALVGHGDVSMQINGEMFHNAPMLPELSPNHQNITATVFQDATTAYPPYDAITDTELSVSLPDNIADAGMRERGVTVWNLATGKSRSGCKIRDKGPWVVSDSAYTVEATARPMVEHYYQNKLPLPSGPNAGVVPTNDAGIDLTPALAEAIGLNGKGKVDWDFD